MLQNMIADADRFGRREFLRTTLISGSSAAAGSGFGLVVIPAMATAQGEVCDILDKLRFVRTDSAHADVLFMGRAAATRFLAALGAKLLPWIGWGIFIGALLYEFGRQIF